MNFFTNPGFFRFDIVSPDTSLFTDRVGIVYEVLPRTSRTDSIQVANYLMQALNVEVPNSGGKTVKSMN